MVKSRGIFSLLKTSIKRPDSFFFVVALIMIASLSHAQKMEDYYKIETVNIPKEIILEAGGLVFNEKGELAVSTRRGEVWLIKNPEAENPTYVRFAHGLHEALGLNYKDGSYYLTQRGELTKLTDIDGDDKADHYETIYSWELSGNYHEYSFGPEFMPNGDMMVTLNLAWIGHGASLVKWRGWMLRITPEGEMTPFAVGMRSPAGFGMNKEGDIFYAENQGDWVGSGRITHVEEGDFVGHPEGLKWSGEPKSPVNVKFNDIVDTLGLSLYQYADNIPAMKPPSVWFPHGVMGTSTSGIKTIPDDYGPFSGQLLVGDQGHSTVMRVMQEKVNDVYQGACFPFVKGFSSGVLRLRWDNEPTLYVGMTSRGWRSLGPKMYGLQRLKWTGKIPFEIKAISAKPDGFELEFTKPLSPNSAKQIAAYSVSDFTYHYHHNYGSPVIDKQNRQIANIEVSEDGLKARLYLDKMRKGYIYEIKAAGVKSTVGTRLIHDVGYYTLNQIPKGNAKTFKSDDSSTASTASIASAKRVTKKPEGWNYDNIQSIELTPIPGLKFNTDLITVKAGAKVKLTFTNPDDMLHNVLIVKPGAVDEIVQEALDLGLDGLEMNYVPKSDDILFHTKLLEPETSESIYFEVPSKPGDYTFVCTFPGHGQVMRGVFRVE